MIEKVTLALRILAGENIVGNTEEVGLIPGKIHFGRLFPFVVTIEAVFIPHRLHYLVVPKPSHAPFRRFEFLRGIPHHQTSGHIWGHRIPICMAAHTALHFAGHHVGETSHPLDRPSFGIEGHEVDWHFGGNAEDGAAVILHIGKTPKLFGCIRGAA